MTGSWSVEAAAVVADVAADDDERVELDSELSSRW